MHVVPEEIACCLKGILFDSNNPCPLPWDSFSKTAAGVRHRDGYWIHLYMASVPHLSLTHLSHKHSLNSNKLFGAGGTLIIWRADMVVMASLQTSIYQGQNQEVCSIVGCPISNPSTPSLLLSFLIIHFQIKDSPFFILSKCLLDLYEFQKYSWK